MDLKKDLDAIFKRIRTLKTKVAQQNPEAFQGMPSCLLNNTLRRPVIVIDFKADLNMKLNKETQECCRDLLHVLMSLIEFLRQTLIIATNFPSSIVDQYLATFSTLRTIKDKFLTAEQKKYAWNYFGSHLFIKRPQTHIILDRSHWNNTWHSEGVGAQHNVTQTLFTFWNTVFSAFRSKQFFCDSKNRLFEILSL